MNIVVIGDVIEDRWIYVWHPKVSPDGEDHFAVRAGRETVEDGAAALVKHNLEVLGHKVSLIVTGTAAKMRFVLRNKILLRVDTYERSEPGGLPELVPQPGECLRTADAVVLSDYGKGAASSREVLEEIRHSKLPVFIDPYPSNYSRYDECFRGKHPGQRVVLCPNAAEFTVEAFLESCDQWFVKLGDRGSDWYRRNGSGRVVLKSHVKALPVVARSTVGAGDAFICVIADQLLRGENARVAMKRANGACGRAIQRPGNVRLDKKDLYWLRS